MRLAATSCFCARLAQAQDYIPTDTPLSDNDVYRLVSCAAPPSGGCEKGIVRWSPADAQDVPLGVAQIAEGYPPRLLQQIDAALDDALADVNASGADLRLTRSEISEIPDMGLYLPDIAEGEEIAGTRIGAAKAQLWWRADRSLIEGAIVFGGACYTDRSIFRETSNQLTRLASQDVMALRRHYP